MHYRVRSKSLALNEAIKFKKKLTRVIDQKKYAVVIFTNVKKAFDKIDPMITLVNWNSMESKGVR